MARLKITLANPFGVVQASPIVDVIDYEINRGINEASSWSLQFPCTVALASQVRARWRVTMQEEGNPNNLLTGGIVTTRTFKVFRNGSGVLALTGGTKAIDMAATNTHVGLAYDGSQSIQAIANSLTGETVAAPAGATGRFPVIKFNDVTILAALLGAAEMARYNVRENFDGTFELTDKDDVPDSGYSFVLASHAGPDYASAGARGLALIAGTPQIGHDGSNLATRITAFGTDFDGSQLTLEHSSYTLPYAIQSGASPDGSTYWYLKDALSETIYDVIERPYVRSDVKNPNDDPTSRQEAANVLYAYAANELLKRRSETVSFATNLANGNEIDALPGSRARVLFKGIARTPDGELMWQDIDRQFLVVKRKDASIRGGVRQVSFTLATPEEELSIPSMPAAHPISEPPGEVPDPPDPIDPDEPPEESGDSDKEVPGIPDVPNVPNIPFGTPVADMLRDSMLGRGPLQPCCADQGADPTGGATPPPFDISRGCVIPWISAAVQTFRFVEKWGGVWADPGLGDGQLHHETDRAIVTLVSSSAPVTCICSGAEVQLLAAYDSNTPANFGGDGHTWYAFYFITPTADTIDFAGTTGAFREVTFFRAAETIFGIQRQFTLDHQYSGAHHNQAIEIAVANQAAIFGDIVWNYINSVYRSIDNLSFTKEFNCTAIPFNHDYFRFNSEFVTFTPSGGDQSATDWMYDTKDDSFLGHSVTCRFTAEADDNGTFPDSTRVFALNASLGLRAFCEQHLLT